MEAHGKTQAQLAAELGVVPSYLSMILNRQRTPSLDVAVQLSRLTGIPVEAFLLREP